MKFQIARDSDMQVEIDVEALARVLSPVARWATVTGKLIYRANRDLTTIDMGHAPPPGYELLGPVGLGNAYIGPWRYFLNDVEISEADYLALEKAVSRCVGDLRVAERPLGQFDRLISGDAVLL